MIKGNIYSYDPAPLDSGELFDIFASGKNFTLERIVSRGHITPEDNWYDQEKDEWVILLEGKAVILYSSGGSVELNKGDWIFIPAHTRHRVTFTSSDPECVWLAIHGSMTGLNQKI
jgi:cupin 2 domain-containing protein